MALIFGQFVFGHKNGSRFETMPLIDLRDRVLLLLRIVTHGRSADMAVINRGFTSEQDKTSGLLGEVSTLNVHAVRFDFGKNWRTSKVLATTLSRAKAPKAQVKILEKAEEGERQKARGAQKDLQAKLDRVIAATGGSPARRFSGEWRATPEDFRA